MRPHVDVSFGDQDIADLLVSTWLNATPYYRISLKDLAAGAGVKESDLWGAVRRRFHAAPKSKLEVETQHRCPRCNGIRQRTHFNLTHNICKYCRQKELRAERRAAA